MFMRNRSSRQGSYTITKNDMEVAARSIRRESPTFSYRGVSGGESIPSPTREQLAEIRDQLFNKRFNDQIEYSPANPKQAKIRIGGSEEVISLSDEQRNALLFALRLKKTQTTLFEPSVKPNIMVPYDESSMEPSLGGISNNNSRILNLVPYFPPRGPPPRGPLDGDPFGMGDPRSPRTGLRMPTRDDFIRESDRERLELEKDKLRLKREKFEHRRDYDVIEETTTYSPKKRKKTKKKKKKKKKKRRHRDPDDGDLSDCSSDDGPSMDYLPKTIIVNTGPPPKEPYRYGDHYRNRVRGIVGLTREEAKKKLKGKLPYEQKYKKCKKKLKACNKKLAATKKKCAKKKAATKRKPRK